MASDWRAYTMSEVQQLARTAKGLTDDSERLCPVCGHRAVRRYVHEHDGPRGAVSMSYVWCSHCHHYDSSTGSSVAASFEFDDPAEDSPELRRLRKTDLLGLLDRLDALWNSGVLPQKFTPR